MEYNPHSTAFSDPLDIEGVKKRSAMQTIGSILPFLWPANNREMQIRVVIAISCLLLGRIANVYGPIVLKDLIDGLEALTTGSRALDGLWVLAFIYGLTVLLPGALNESKRCFYASIRVRSTDLRASDIQTPPSTWNALSPGPPHWWSFPRHRTGHARTPTNHQPVRF